MKLNAFEAHWLVESEFFLMGKNGPDLGAEGVCSLADVPRAKGKTILGWFAHSPL